MAFTSVNLNTTNIYHRSGREPRIYPVACTINLFTIAIDS